MDFGDKVQYSAMVVHHSIGQVGTIGCDVFKQSCSRHRDRMHSLNLFGHLERTGI